MLSLTNPFRKPFVATTPQAAVQPMEPSPVPSSTTSQPAAPTQSPPLRPNEHQLSSLLGACEAGTHSFSHEDFGSAGRGSWGMDTFRRMSGGLSTSTDSNASVVAKPVAAKIVSTGWPISRTGSGHFDPSRDPRLLYL